MNEAVRRNPIQRLFDMRVRGFRLVEVVAAVVLAATIGFVYVAKTGAAEEADQIADLEAEVRVNQQRVRLLRAEVASLERPERMAALSDAAGLAPMAPDRQAEVAALPDLAGVQNQTGAPAQAQAGLNTAPTTALLVTEAAPVANTGSTGDREGPR